MSLASFVYRPWINALLYEGTWLLCVLGRERLVVVALGLVVLHVVLCRERRTELLVMAAVGAVGVAVDCALVLGGLFVFDPAPTFLPIPFWLVVIWLSFASTLRHALAFVVARAPLAIALGAVGGPLSYVAAARLDAVSLPHGTWPTAAVLAVLWAALMPGLGALVRAIGAVRTVPRAA